MSVHEILARPRMVCMVEIMIALGFTVDLINTPQGTVLPTGSGSKLLQLRLQP